MLAVQVFCCRAIREKRLMMARVSRPDSPESSSKGPNTMAVSISTMQNAQKPSRNKAFPALLAAAALVGFGSTSSAQVALKTYADEKGYINIRTLTCAQLAGTFQEDADFLGLWYSGWYNGHIKKHSINVPRTKTGIHEVIVFCKANPDKKVIDAVELVLKSK
jgi:hypothetical protein